MSDEDIEKDTHNLDYHIAKYTLPRLKKFKEVSKTYNSEHESPEAWDKTLDKMIYSLEFIVKNLDSGADDLFDSYHRKEIGREEYLKICNEESAKIQEGLELFGKYFRSLWW